MDSIITFLISIGPAGMLISAFLAGSVLPFSSEIVMAGLLKAGVPALSLLLWGTIGNVAGSMLNYIIGRLCSLEWITAHMRINPERVKKAQTWVSKYGAWIAIFAFLPVIGTAIAYALGLMRTNAAYTFLALAVGKILRYSVLIWVIGLV